MAFPSSRELGSVNSAQPPTVNLTMATRLMMGWAPEILVKRRFA
ncbi:hypothetical protein PC118_g15498 [Phytophthora cactorum]|uniref:Uncharacterized protein n=1 Tax=Phytophthora cactorum TaxID=29920 RepID=A0A8T1FCI5_9STRA|nr:hypothetical protein PC112_g15093 [Phytophthora cactorum]KAG2812716.1 hypothetical protein PC111_g14700 [Phytophthora cactorum]KAG2862138.1 hypothetical protein PC113_g6571 [Phytophthora cactorum]KAG2972809.1 hypothetical protein PC118_g15498 [Phytophthora cactorum]KAG3180301.1 hypothetical protein C6341_g7004 [Phytophthora cactorum]